jgi:hypothetical protein
LSCRLLGLLVTFCGFAKAGLFSTTVHLKTALQLYEKTVNRSTAPPLLQNRCCKLAFCLRHCQAAVCKCFAVCVGCAMAGFKIFRRGGDLKK